jgi:DNA-binding XRE family transcriptional regulator
MRHDNFNAIRRALENAGIEFVDGEARSKSRRGTPWMSARIYPTEIVNAASWCLPACSLWGWPDAAYETVRTVQFWRGYCVAHCATGFTIPVAGKAGAFGRCRLPFLLVTTPGTLMYDTGGPQMTITGAQVKAARELLGWSQAMLAGEVGVNAATVGRFETGKQNPPLLDISAIARALEWAGVEFAGDGQGVKLKRALR